MHDIYAGHPRHQSIIVTNFLATSKVKVLEWPSNSIDHDENEFVDENKEKVGEKQPFSDKYLIRVKELSNEY